jgi:murein DD-endopeptidase MepM/ murein hydrolase activator NlpD
MKKAYLVILLTLITMFHASGCNIIENVSEIELFNSESGEHTIIPGNDKSAKNILKAIKTNNKTKDNISDLIFYEIKVKKNSRTDYYKLIFDPNNKSAYVSKNNDIYTVDAVTAADLLEDENFSYVYVGSTLYNSYLNYNGKDLRPEIKYDWNYKDTKGNFIEKEGTIKGFDDESNIKICDGDSIDIAYEKVPDRQVVRAYLQDELVSAGSSLKEVLDTLTNDGEYEVESTAQWLIKEDSNFYGSQTLKFTVNIDRPASAAVETKENYPGNILVVSVENLNSDETLKCKTGAVKIETEMYRYKNKTFFICPIDLYTNPGDYDLSVIVNEGTDEEYVIDSSFIIKSKAFKTQYLTLSEEMNESNNDSTAMYEFQQIVKPARTESASEKLWHGTFEMPVEGELTTDFAENRHINNEKSSSRHSGLDLAAPLGTEVKASNDGVVTLAAEELLSTGNTVVIDHGMGVFTSYYHLDTISVEKGQKISKGEIIGTVGTTGFSTGPHLHYAVSIYNTYVNPYQALSGIID